MQGVALLRERIAAKVLELYSARYDPASEITITSGATEALFAAITAVVGRNNEVIVFEPAFDSYVPVIELCGGTPVYIQLKFPEYTVDWDEVRAAVSEKTRLIILNFPHNPTGFADFMQKKEVYLQLPGFYQKKRDLFQAFIEKSRFKVLPCHGTYFQMLDYSSITDEPDLEFARRLTVDFGVAAIPPSVFYHRKNDYKVLRFCFAKKDETLEEAAQRLGEV
jgi:aspartate/methionine/tyrosine aminotransferase